jgi:hypothetical protein
VPAEKCDGQRVKFFFLRGRREGISILHISKRRRIAEQIYFADAATKEENNIFTG